MPHRRTPIDPAYFQSGGVEKYSVSIRLGSDEPIDPAYWQPASATTAVVSALAQDLRSSGFEVVAAPASAFRSSPAPAAVEAEESATSSSPACLDRSET
jgi:hypothetical protein